MPRQDVLGRTHPGILQLEAHHPVVVLGAHVGVKPFDPTGLGEYLQSQQAGLATGNHLGQVDQFRQLAFWAKRHDPGGVALGDQDAAVLAGNHRPGCIKAGRLELQSGLGFGALKVRLP